MRQMSVEERRAFLLEGTRTAKLGVTRRDGSPYVLPVWSVLAGDDVVFTTGAETVRGRALRRDGRASICVDEERPPYGFVGINGSATLSEDPGEKRRGRSSKRSSSAWSVPLSRGASVGHATIRECHSSYGVCPSRGALGTRGMSPRGWLTQRPRAGGEARGAAEPRAATRGWRGRERTGRDLRTRETGATRPPRSPDRRSRRG